MKMQTLGWVIGFTALASSASILACSQAKVQCSIEHAGANSYAVKYYSKTSPAPACAIPGDLVGFESYHPPGGGSDGKQPDFSKPAIIAYQTDTMGNLVANAAGDDTSGDGKPYTLGAFTTLEPDDTDFCAVTSPKPATKSYAAVPDDPMTPEMDGVPAMTQTDEWSNVKVYVTAASLGTQFSGHLKQTIDTCSAEYDVAGVWPTVSCGKDIPDPSDPTGMKTMTVVDPSQCCPLADPNSGRPFGSGINPDFPLKCDPELFLCVLDIKDPSALPAVTPGWADKLAVCAVTPPAAGTTTGM